MGFIPKYEDLVELFKKELATSYSKEDYELQFLTRVPELLEKLDIAEEFFRKETSHVPGEIFDMINIQRKLLLEAQRPMATTSHHLGSKTMRCLCP